MAEPSAQGTRAGSPLSRGSLVLAFLLWLFIAGFVAASFGFTPRARVLPQVIGFPLLLVATVNLIREVRVVFLGKDDRVGGRPAGEDEIEVGSRAEEAIPFLWLSALVGLVLGLGLLLGSMLFLALFLRVYGRERWLIVVAMPVVFFVLIELAFVEFFGFRVFPGYLLPALGIPTDFIGIG